MLLKTKWLELINEELSSLITENTEISNEQTKICPLGIQEYTLSNPMGAFAFNTLSKTEEINGW